MTEAVAWNRMAADGWKIRFYNEILTIYEYQPDGLHSHNPQYKTIHPGPDDNFRCVGRVLGVVTQDMYPTAQELDVLNEVYSEKHKR